ncbi:MAG: Nif11-like leader peptide family natural product precursor [Myxococcales bacterium]|nr:Nif11-like leader peptide family natural product precursor [Myxococcales bacterium]
MPSHRDNDNGERRDERGGERRRDDEPARGDDHDRGDPPSPNDDERGDDRERGRDDEHGGEGERRDTRSSPVARFIRRLENRAFRRSLASKLITIKEGDWQAVVEIAAAEGFRFSVEELKAAMPDAFFKGAGKRPRRFWSRSTLEL